MIQDDFYQKASALGSASPAPFLKWAGGKTQMLPHLTPFFPETMRRYFEPFLGGGAVFFHLRGQGRLSGEVVLADVNIELINAYRAVQMNVSNLMLLLDLHQTRHCEGYYYEMRARHFTEDVAGAARTVYLNRTCFNGLYRVNSRGQFNVPIGDYKNPRLYDVAALQRSAQALQGVSLLAQPYEETLALCQHDDFVYLDPPYLPLSSTSSFTGYTPLGFGLEDQERLASHFLDCHKKGVSLVLSNSQSDDILTLYQRFHICHAPARRSISCVGAQRTPIQELIITNAGVHGRMI